MILIICIDDDAGMMFNHRRQSKDRVLREKLIQNAHGHTLRMNSYSSKQFGKLTDNVIVSEDFIEKSTSGDYCFVEDTDPGLFEDLVEKIIVYKWNRLYPSDLKCSINLKGNDWNLSSSDEFVGSSHDLITEEVYIK